MVILAGNFEKTETQLAIYRYSRAGEQFEIDLQPVAYDIFNNEEYKGKRMPEMLKDFLDKHYNLERQEQEQPIYGACFSVAGRIEGETGTNQKVTIENPDTEFKETFTVNELRSYLRYPKVPISFINDMEAIGYGIFLGDQEEALQFIYSGNEETNLTQYDSRALLLVSDGLGQAFWKWNSASKRLEPDPSEGGHIDFSPRRTQEVKRILESFEMTREDDDQTPIEYEEILSKSGLVKIAKFFHYGNVVSKSEEGYDLNDDEIYPNLKSADAIIQAALSEDQSEISESCRKALNIFLDIFGAQAGNIVITYNAKAIYIGGVNIAEETFKNGIFEKAFLNKKGQRRKDNAKVPVKLFDLETTNFALEGAAKFAIDEGYIITGAFATI